MTYDCPTLCSVAATGVIRAQIYKKNAQVFFSAQVKNAQFKKNAQIKMLRWKKMLRLECSDGKKRSDENALFEKNAQLEIPQKKRKLWLNTYTNAKLLAIYM